MMQHYLEKTNSMENHPSLKPQPLRTSKTAAETIIALNHEINSIQETIASVKDKTGIVETDLSSLDSIQILANVEQRFVDFTEKYGAVLDKLYANAEAEAALISSMKDKVSKL